MPRARRHVPGRGRGRGGCGELLFLVRLTSSSACTRKDFCFCLFKRFLPFPKAKPGDCKSTNGIDTADMSEFIADACNEEHDRELQTGACTCGIGQDVLGVELFPNFDFVVDQEPHCGNGDDGNHDAPESGIWFVSSVKIDRCGDCKTDEKNIEARTGDLKCCLLELVEVFAALAPDSPTICQIPMPEITSTKESTPNPKSAMLPSSSPKKTETTPSAIL